MTTRIRPARAEDARHAVGLHDKSTVVVRLHAAVGHVTLPLGPVIPDDRLVRGAGFAVGVNKDNESNA